MIKQKHSLTLAFVLLLPSLSLAADAWPGFNLLEAAPAQLPTPVTVTVTHDPVYKSAKAYEAYPLADILKQIGLPGSAKTDELVLVLTAEDGYSVAMAYQDALAEQGFIAFKDHAAPANKNWLDFKFGKQTMTPAPYYLVWPKEGLDEWRYPWPFQLSKLSLQTARSYYGAAAPAKTDAAVSQGFNLFSRYCIRCHSVNLAGGEVGPELNIPKNINEYFKEQELPGFILNAPAYRAKTKMPAFNGMLSASDAQDIVQYLKQMQHEKTQ